MLAEAMAFLQNGGSGKEAERLGGQCLMGLAAYKYNKRFGDNPDQLPGQTLKALNLARAAVDKPSSADLQDIYSLGIALIFLCEVYPHQNSSAIQFYVGELLRYQKPHGGWGYLSSKTGDLSQLQYAALGLWSAQNAGANVPDGAVSKLIDYVIRVQDPSGAWGYQGKDPGNYMRIPQTQVRPSLTAAGIGTLYVLSDFLGMSKEGEVKTIAGKPLPPALIPVVAPEDRPGARMAAVNSDQLSRAMADGNRWIRNLPTLETDKYQLYFLYGLERYQSFKEKVEGTYEDEPRWYNEGVELLQATQNRRGNWGKYESPGLTYIGTSPPIATSFAVLFLLRSTRETIEKVMERDGLLRGGYGLPSDLTEIRVRGNQIVAPAITGEVEDLISMLEDEEGEKIENLLENPDALSLSGMTGSGREFTERLVRILRTGKSYKARIVAARTLGRQGELDNVPILIYALTDPDPRVMRAARDGLRLTSRKFDGFGLPDSPTEGKLGEVVNRWKAWYKSIRPDAVFIK